MQKKNTLKIKKTVRRKLTLLKNLSPRKKPKRKFDWRVFPTTCPKLFGPRKLMTEQASLRVVIAVHIPLFLPDIDSFPFTARFPPPLYKLHVRQHLFTQHCKHYILVLLVISCSRVSSLYLLLTRVKIKIMYFVFIVRVEKYIL